jgi:hypothetical protein
MPTEATTPDRDGIRKYIVHEGETNPFNVEIVEYMGAAVTRPAGTAWLNRQEVLGTLPCIGTAKGLDGRTNLKIHCRTDYKKDNLRHQLIGTYARILYPTFECEREPRERACFCDMTLKNSDHIYEVEIDCGTHKQLSFKSRVKRHKCERDILFIVAPKTGDADRRVKQIMDWSVGIAEQAYFTTLERLQTQGPHAYVWDFIGREGRPFKRVKMPVLEAVQKYTHNTGETLEISPENEDSADGD